MHRTAGERSDVLDSCRRAVDIAVALGSSWMRALSLLDLARTLRHFGGDGGGAPLTPSPSPSRTHVRPADEARAELTMARGGALSPVFVRI